MTTNVMSSQEFRNAYEKFYKYMRDYLWPYPVVENLADVEVEIYTSFPDLEKLKRDLIKLSRPISEVCKDNEDEQLQKTFDAIVELVNEAEEDNLYSIINRVEEVNPDEDKTIKSEEDESDEDDSIEESEFLFETSREGE